MNDALFYQKTGLPGAALVMRHARNQIYALFCREFPPNAATRILDIGCSTEEHEHSNFLEKQYPYQQMITCAGLADGANITVALPHVRYVRIEADRPLPFATGEFDIAYSNAVLEHAGDASARRRFVSEALRVARSAFIAIPNRWFPIEHHTGLPLLHYSPALFRRLLKSTRLDYWSREAHLAFLSARSLRRECGGSPGFKVVHSGLRLGPLSSNVAAIWRRFALAPEIRAKGGRAATATNAIQVD